MMTNENESIQIEPKIDVTVDDDTDDNGSNSIGTKARREPSEETSSRLLSKITIYTNVFAVVILILIFGAEKLNIGP